MGRQVGLLVAQSTAQTRLVNAVKQGATAAHALAVRCPQWQRWFRYVLALCVLTVLSDFVADPQNTRDFPGADFRRGVVKYRLLISGRDPCRSHWTAGMSARLTSFSKVPSSRPSAENL